MFTKFVLNWDIFGYMPSPHINKSRNYKTIFGSLISLIVVLLIMGSIWQFGREIIYKITPNIIEYIEYSHDHDMILNFTNKNFVFGFSIKNYTKSSNQLHNYPNSIQLNTTPFDFQASFLNYNFIDNHSHRDNHQITNEYSILINETNQFHNNIDNYKKAIEIKPCSLLKTSNDQKYIFNSLVENSLCFDFKEEDNISLFINNLFDKKFLNFELNVCSNTIFSNIDYQDNICKNETTIEEYLSDLKITFYIINPIINPSDYNNPLTHTLIEMEEFLNPKFKKEIELTFSQLEIQSEIGWLMEDIRTIKSYELQRTNTLINTNLWRRKFNKLLDLSINLSQNLHVYKRLYIKVQNIAANLGGIIKSLLLIGEVVVYFFSKIEFKEYLVNIFFDETKISRSDSLINNINHNILNSSNHPLTKIFHPTTNQMYLYFLKILIKINIALISDNFYSY